MRYLRSASLVAVLTVGSVLAGATPSWAGTTLKSANGSAYCKLLTSYDKKQTAANKALQTPGGAAASIKAAYEELDKVEGVILGVAPSSLQKPYKTVFKTLNTFYGTLSKVGYNYAKLSKADVASFEAMATTMEVSSNKISAYDKNVCGVKG